MGTLRCRSAMNLIGRSYHRLSEAFIYSRMNVYRQIGYIIIHFVYRTHDACPISISYNFDSLLTRIIFTHIHPSIGINHRCIAFYVTIPMYTYIHNAMIFKADKTWVYTLANICAASQLNISSNNNSSTNFEKTFS